MGRLAAMGRCAPPAAERPIRSTARTVNRDADAEALVTFLPTSEGGRRGPARSGYRPNHLVLPDYLTTGVHDYVGRSWVLPGDSVRARITFIAPEHYPYCLWPGRLVHVQEGGRLVGRAEILRVFNPELLGESSRFESLG